MAGRKPKLKEIGKTRLERRKYYHENPFPERVEKKLEGIRKASIKRAFADLQKDPDFAELMKRQQAAADYLEKQKGIGSLPYEKGKFKQKQEALSALRAMQDCWTTAYKKLNERPGVPKDLLEIMKQEIASRAITIHDLRLSLLTTLREIPAL